MNRYLVLGLALAACSGPPLVDMTDVDPVVYQRDLDACESQAQSYDTAGPAVAGAIMGASFGLGAGAVAVGAPEIMANSSATGLSLATGTAAGAGVSAAANAPLAVPPPAPRQTVAQCLESRGYKIITAAAPR